MGDTLVKRMNKQDLIRAEKVGTMLEEARNKALEASELLRQAVIMAENDSYQGVKDYDSRDIKDIQSVLRIAVLRPINHLSMRWVDIIHGRRAGVEE